MKRVVVPVVMAMSLGTTALAQDIPITVKFICVTEDAAIEVARTVPSISEPLPGGCKWVAFTPESDAVLLKITNVVTLDSGEVMAIGRVKNSYSLGYSAGHFELYLN